MKISHLYVALATLGPIGYIWAPGTAATLVTLPLVFALHQLSKDMQWIVLIAGIGISWLIINGALNALERHDDPDEIVLDEVIGCIITFMSISLSWWSVILGFILFRLLDIFKLFGIARLEMIAGPWGILIDDMAAGILANIILRMIV